MNPRQSGAGDLRTDAELVRAFLSGDGNALGGLYDRFAPGLYDTATAMLRDRDAAGDVVQDVFCVAATKLGQLRDQTLVKPWLYAIARNEVYRRTKQRSRTTPFSAIGLDGFGDEGGMDPMAPPDPHGEGAGAVSHDLASLVRDAAFGLDPSDQLILELSARQGLVGAELASAIGVSTAQAHSMLYRMRDRLERAVGAVVVTRGGRKRCEDLAAVLTGWDGRFDVIWRKRISRHIDDCETCQETRRGAAVLSMAGLAPAFALPAMLRDRTLAKALAPGSTAGSHYRFDADGFPKAAAGGGSSGGSDGPASRSLVIAVTATLVAALAIVLPLVLVAQHGMDASIADDVAAPVTLESTPATLAPVVAPTTTATATSTTTLPPPLPPTAPPTVVPTAPPSATPTVPPTARPTIAIVAPPSVLLVGPTTTTTTTASGSAPQIRSFSVSPDALDACGNLSPEATASVFDRDADITSVSVAWRGQGGSGSTALTGSNPYRQAIGPLPAVSGRYAVTLTVTDSAGREDTSSTTISVAPC